MHGEGKTWERRAFGDLVSGLEENQQAGDRQDARKVSRRQLSQNEVPLRTTYSETILGGQDVTGGQAI